MPSIEKRNRGYCITVSAGYTSSGKKIRKKMTWTPTPGMTERQIEKEVQRQAILFGERIQTGLSMDGNIKFEDFAERWMKEYSETQHKAKGVFQNKLALDRINKALGHIKLAKLQPHHIIQFLHQMEEPGQNKKTGKGLSAKTVLNHHRVISSILSTAVNWGIITDNPAKRVKPPKVHRLEARSLDDAQTLQLLEALEDVPAKFRIATETLLFSGARRGELLGLKWDDIDFQACTMDINKASLYLPNKGIYEDSPKNENSKRVIKLPRIVIEHLQQYRAIQAAERLQCGDLWTGAGHVFTQWNGSPMHPDSLTSWFSKFIKRYNEGAGCPLPLVSLHSLRHTNASLLIAEGIDIRTVAKRLGHAQVSTTMDIYSHAIKSADANASDALEARLLAKPQ